MSPKFQLLLSALVGLCFTCNSVLAQTQTTEGVPQPRIVKGIVKTPSGNPLAGATLFLYDRPQPAQVSDPTFPNRVVTDANGRFTWTVTDDRAWEFIQSTEGWVLPQDTSWTIQAGPEPKGLFRHDSPFPWGISLPSYKVTSLSNTTPPELSIVTEDIGELDVLVRDPTGRPAKNQPVEVIPAQLFADRPLVYRGQTDSMGHLHWRDRVGQQRLQILVPKIGFGSTGNFEILPDKVVTSSLAPLARFARISGTIAPEVYKLGAYVAISRSSHDDNPDPRMSAQITPNYRFTLENVVPGTYFLRLYKGKAQTGVRTVVVQPGEHLSGISLQPETTPPTQNPGRGSTRSTPANSSREFKSLLSGRITDVSGNPVANADVYAITTSPNEFNFSQETQKITKTTTDKQGNYAFPQFKAGLPEMTLVAVRQGSPPAVLHPQNPLKPSYPPTGKNLHVDMVIPNGHTQLTVKVIREGKPVEGARVWLRQKYNYSLQGGYYGEDKNPNADRLLQLFTPNQTTNAEGEVEFTDLLPGLWDAVTIPKSEDGRLMSDDGFSNYWRQLNRTFVRNIAIQNGSSSRITLNILPIPKPIMVQILGPDGKPNSQPETSAGLSSDYISHKSSSISFNQQGSGQFNEVQSGLWSLYLHYKETSTESSLGRFGEEPFYQANALLALSSSFPQSETVNTRVIRRNGGTLRIRLEDHRGHPVGGTVIVGQSFASDSLATTIQAKGGAIFNALPSGIYVLRASVINPTTTTPVNGKPNSFPTDEELTNKRQFAPQTAVVRSDAETTITLHPQLQAYVRGYIDVPGSLSDYRLSCSSANERISNDFIPVQFIDKTGEFLAGPIYSDKAFLSITRMRNDQARPKYLTEKVLLNAMPGKVVHTNITARALHALDTARPNTDRILTDDGGFNIKADSYVAGPVYLADGKTPAWGSQATVYNPVEDATSQIAVADALGRLSISGNGYRSSHSTIASPEMPGGSTNEPVLVVWLPGSTGATIVPGTSKVNTPIVLPPAISVRGKVTVGGQPVTNLLSSFIVKAAYQGKGKLNPLLSVETTPNADGSFELSGLTPGNYTIQAARDGIWLSNSVQVVDVSNDMPNLTFDIAPIGAPLNLHLVDVTGKPLVDQTINLKRPAGPLAEQYWPKTLNTDAIGNLHLEGWEVGTHKFEVASQGKSFSVTIAPFIEGKPTETRTVIVR